MCTCPNVRYYVEMWKQRWSQNIYKSNIKYTHTQKCFDGWLDITYLQLSLLAGISINIHTFAQTSYNLIMSSFTK